MALIHLPSQQKDSFGKRFGNTFTPALLGGLDRYAQEEAAKRKATREALLEEESQKNKHERDIAFEKEKFNLKNSPEALAKDQESADAIGKAFGDEAKAIYPHLTEGGKTKLTQTLLEGKLRGIDTRQLLGGFIQSNPEAIADEQEPDQEINQFDQASSIQAPQRAPREFPAYRLDTTNMLPKERVAYQKELRGYNDPVLKEANTAKKTAEKSLKSYQALAKLSPKIPQGLSRFFYDAGGNIRPLAQVVQAVPPEAEEYVKVINDFTTQAKDSYGSRVTNFDLQQFMRRLPTLANSSEGRKLILKRMQETSQADALFNKTMEDVYRHYGAGNITPEDAFRISEEVSGKRLERLQQESEQTDAEIAALSGDEDKNSQLPDAASNNGKIIKNSETGQRLRSDGSRWVPL